MHGPIASIHLLFGNWLLDVVLLDPWAQCVMRYIEYRRSLGRPSSGLQSAANCGPFPEGSDYVIIHLESNCTSLSLEVRERRPSRPDTAGGAAMEAYVVDYSMQIFSTV